MFAPFSYDRVTNKRHLKMRIYYINRIKSTEGVEWKGIIGNFPVIIKLSCYTMVFNPHYTHLKK